MHELKTVLNVDKFVNDNHTLYNRLNASRLKLRDFEKHENM